MVAMLVAMVVVVETTNYDGGNNNGDGDGGVVVAMTEVEVVVVAKSVIIKYGKCVFLTKNQIHKTFFLGFENECKIVSKMI